MFSLLIAEDEEDIRKGIANFINWNAQGIEICGEAEDGTQALKLIRELSPDIVLIDIRMPEMNGLKVIETIHSENLPVKSIIISGYDDFSYVQEALKLGVSCYLLKPCRPEEILENVLSVKAEIENERSKKKIYEELLLKFNENLPLIKDHYLTRLIPFESNYMSKMLEDFELYKINIKAKNILIAIVRIDNIQESYAVINSKDLELTRFAVKNTLDEVISSKFKCEVFENDDGIIIIANVDKNLYYKEFLPLLEKVKKFVRDNMDFTISIGIGRVYNDISDIQYSYSDALGAIEAMFLMGTDSIIEYEALPDEVINDNCYPMNEEKKILNSIQTGNIFELEQRLEEFFIRLNPGRLSKEITLKSCLALVFSLYHLCVETHTNSEEIFGQEFSVVDSFLKIDTLSQMKEKLVKIAMKLLEKVNSEKVSNKIIEQSLKYIENNYHRDLSLVKVANSVFISPKYYCLLFKQSMGINFVDYLNKLRIESACELLKDVRLKTYEIAYKVGYSNDKYFCQIFKKYKGISPTQYRGNIAL